MTLLELMPIPPKMRRLRARLKPECNQRISEKAKLWTSTEYGKLHMARMTELGRTPEARAKQSKTRIRMAEANRRREASLACVDPTWRRCHFCKLFDDPEAMTSLKTMHRYYHKPCAAKWAVEYRRKKRMAA
jgi:hypothetical protein